MDNITNFIKENATVYNGISAALILYITVVIPRMTYDILKYLNSGIVKFILLVIVFLISLKNVPLALIGGLALLMMIMQLDKLETDRKILDSIKYTNAANILDRQVSNNYNASEIPDDKSISLPDDLMSSDMSLSLDSK